MKKYTHFLWWGFFSVLFLVCIGLAISIWVRGGSETEQAMQSGRRLLVALDTGEITGKNLTLDGEVPPLPSPPVEVPAAKEAPAELPPPEAPVVPETNAPTPVETPTQDSPSEQSETINTEPLPPATPTPEANPALMEKGEVGNLPVISKEGIKPWRYYSKPFTRQGSQPMVAIIVTGLGTGRTITQDALELPENVTLSFSPYARDIEGWSPAIRAMGHELLVDLPLQPVNYPATDPGPQGLLLEKGPEKAELALQWAVSRYPAFIGMLTPQNESFTANDEGMKALMQFFANRGLLLIMGKEPHRKETRALIDASHNAVLVADVLIDEELSEASIQARLALLVEQAQKNGYAIGIAQSYPITIEQLNVWSRTLAEKGLVLVPVSAIAKLRFS